MCGICDYCVFPERSYLLSITNMRSALPSVCTVVNTTPAAKSVRILQPYPSTFLIRPVYDYANIDQHCLLVNHTIHIPHSHNHIRLPSPTTSTTAPHLRTPATQHLTAITPITAHTPASQSPRNPKQSHHHPQQPQRPTPSQHAPNRPPHSSRASSAYVADCAVSTRNNRCPSARTVRSRSREPGDEFAGVCPRCFGNGYIAGNVVFAANGCSGCFCPCDGVFVRSGRCGLRVSDL